MVARIKYTTNLGHHAKLILVPLHFKTELTVDKIVYNCIKKFHKFMNSADLALTIHVELFFLFY